MDTLYVNKVILKLSQVAFKVKCKTLFLKWLITTFYNKKTCYCITKPVFFITDLKNQVPYIMINNNIYIYISQKKIPNIATYIKSHYTYSDYTCP